MTDTGLILNADNVKKALSDYYLAALIKVEDRLIEILKEEVMNTVYGDGPGKPKWREELRNSIRELSRTVTDQYIELGAGAPALIGQEGIAKKVRAMIVEEGGGSAVGNPPIHRGPKGRSVWDDDITRRRPSKSNSTSLLPSEFNQPGNHFIENAVKRIQTVMVDTINEASRNLPITIFSDNLSTK